MSLKVKKVNAKGKEKELKDEKKPEECNICCNVYNLSTRMKTQCPKCDELNSLLNYCNEELMKIGKQYNCVVPHYSHVY